MKFRSEIKNIYIKLLIKFWLQPKVKSLGNNYIPKHYNTYLIIAPHPDDEVFGLGGLISKLTEEDSKIYILYLTDGENSEVWPDKNVIKANRIRLSEQICLRLGITATEVIRLHICDGSVPNKGSSDFKDIIESLVRLFDQIKPDIVLATHPLDFWPYDHVACAEIARNAVENSIVKPQLWYYWVWAWYNIRPWHLSVKQFNKLEKIDISHKLENKKRLSGIYMNSFTPDGKPWIGILPEQLKKTFNFPFEIIERVL